MTSQAQVVRTDGVEALSDKTLFRQKCYIDGAWCDGTWEWNGVNWTQRCTAAQPCATTPCPSRKRSGKTPS